MKDQSVIKGEFDQKGDKTKLVSQFWKEKNVERGRRRRRREEEKEGEEKGSQERYATSMEYHGFVWKLGFCMDGYDFVWICMDLYEY